MDIKLFEHYIITRFNLPVFQAKVDGHDALSACDEQYLDYRFQLFEKYCMPSIVGQTCQNFKWLILMDARTPERFKKRLEELHQQYDNLHAFYLNLEDYKRPHPAEYIRRYDEYAPVAGLPNSAELIEWSKPEIQFLIQPRFINDCIRSLSRGHADWIVTTRIDNDDAFHKDMIATLQKRIAIHPKFVVLDYPLAYKYVLNPGYVFRYEYPNNHFLTLVEPNSAALQTAIYWNHTEVEKMVKVEHTYCKPLQLELIHGNNVINFDGGMTAKGMLYATLRFRQSDFGYRAVKRSWYWTIKYCVAPFLGKLKSLF